MDIRQHLIHYLILKNSFSSPILHRLIPKLLYLFFDLDNPQIMPSQIRIYQSDLPLFIQKCGIILSIFIFK